jgi:prepilin-type processing-associated H-X9-DG protein
MSAQPSTVVRICRRRMAKPCGLLLVWLLLFMPCQPSQCEPTVAALSNVAEFQVKAVYLYKFVGYIEWPQNTFSSPDSPITIGIRGADSMANELTRVVAAHADNGRAIVVRKLGNGDSLSGINILFIGNDQRETYAEILAAAKGLPILTVTENEDALSHGSMINFVLVDGHVRFEAAPKTAKLSNLSISARLLAAAYRIIGEAS